jgi:simple sugar transport system permease protein
VNPFNAFWVTTTLALTAPILLAAMGELLAERSGVLNIGLEGMMLGGAFSAFLATHATHSLLLGVLAGAAAGAFLGLVMCVLALSLRADQIVVGVGINLVTAGATSFLFEQLYGGAFVSVKRMRPLALPLLSKLPGVGDTVFRQPVLVYVALLAVPVVWYALYRTRWGLGVRATGEAPGVADTAGLSVARIRSTTTLIAGAMAGMGGSFLALTLGTFVEGMSGGRGFLAIAAVIFGRWRPWAAVLGCFLFGGADALQLELQSNPAIPRALWLAVVLAAVAVAALGVFARRRFPMTRAGMSVALAVALSCVALFVAHPAFRLPPQIWASLPYVLSLLVLAGFIGRSRMPSGLSQPYRREVET